jgi:hypothetical protein
MPFILMMKEVNNYVWCSICTSSSRSSSRF